MHAMCTCITTGTRNLQRLCVITGDHKRAIIGLSFNRTGEFIASMGLDNNRSVALYRWKSGASLEKMRIGIDKGHSDEVYQLHYNPVTDHIVAGGKKFLRFFGLKEGALSDPEADARAAAKAGGSHTPLLAENESKIWAKKGTFGAEKGAQDILSLAFDNDGVTYAGSGEGIIYRFSEQVRPRLDTLSLLRPSRVASVASSSLCCFAPSTERPRP
jgi:microtubule-associated protein-like 6